VRALWTLPVALCAGCLASPPDSTDTEADGGADCKRYEFENLDGFLVTEAPGCRIESPARLRLVQEDPLAADDGCFVEPEARFAVGSLTIEYGSESNLPVGVIVYRPSDSISAALNRWSSSTLELNENLAGDPLNQDTVEFDPSWTHWRLDFSGGEVAASAGPSRAELEERMRLPFAAEAEMGIVLGSWPGDEPTGQREASFDHLEICP